MRAGSEQAGVLLKGATGTTSRARSAKTLEDSLLSLATTKSQKGLDFPRLALYYDLLRLLSLHSRSNEPARAMSLRRLGSLSALSFAY